MNHLVRAGILAGSLAFMATSILAETSYRMNIPAKGMKAPDVDNVPPYFWYPQTYPWTKITLRGAYPAFGDSSSISTVSFDVNFGQRPFKGEMPPGYLPYDPKCSWTTITPSNLGTIVYQVGRFSGKYYYEVTINNASVAEIGFVPAQSPAVMGQLDKIINSQGIALGNYYGNIHDFHNRQLWYNKWVNGWTIQVYVDYDYDRVSYRVLGTDISEYPNAIRTDQQ